MSGMKGGGSKKNGKKAELLNGENDDTNDEMNDD